MAGRLTSAATSYRKCVNIGCYHQKNLRLPCLVLSHNASSKSTQTESRPITGNLELITLQGRSGATSARRPLAVIFSWMLAKKSHIMKYGDFYMQQGFDVLTVKISPFQLFWPTIGSQVIVKSVLEFLAKRDDYQPIVIHAFSVGAYMCGEAMLQLEADRKKYEGIADRIVGQVYDSAADYTEISAGVPKAVTNNQLLRKIIASYVRFHMAIFYATSTRHYVRASEEFHDTKLRAPSLFLYSKNDPVGTPKANERTMKEWRAKGMTVYSRCWESSPHVSHMYHYQEEYLQELESFLKTLGLLTVPNERKTNSKL